jgi:hypothetical protein
MRPTLTLLLAVTMASVSLAQHGPADEQAVADIRDGLAARVNAFNKKDAAMLAAFYKDDADFRSAITYDPWWHGRDRIEDVLRVVLAGPFAAPPPRSHCVSRRFGF